MFGALLVAILSGVSAVTWAAPSALTYQGRILKSDGTPLEYSNVSFLFQITDPSGSCILYQEQVTGYSMTGSKGIFDVAIGRGTMSWPTTGGFSILDSFNNSSSYTCGACSGYSCSAGSGSYSPLNTDGRVLRVHFYDGHGWKTVSPDTVIRSVPFAGYAVSAQKLGEHEVTAFVLKNEVNSNVSCGGGSQFLTWNAASKTFGCSGVSGTNGGTVTDVTVAAPLVVTNGQSTPHITIQAASSSQHGYLTSTDWTTFNNKLGSTTNFGGDVSGTAANISVDKIKNAAVSFSSLSSGDFLKYSGGNWVNSTIAVSDIANLSTNLAGKPDYSQFPTSCTAAQTMTFISPVGGFTCTTIAIPGTQVSGNIAGNAAGFSGSLGGDVTGTQSSTTVTKIRNVTVSATAPSPGDVLKYDNGTSSWVPSADTASTATSANTASTIVSRDASGNFAAGTITANLTGNVTGNVTGSASLNVLKAGDSMSGNLTHAANTGNIYTAGTGAGTVTLQGPTNAIGSNYTLRLPTSQSSGTQALVNDGSGNLSWQNLSSGSVTSVATGTGLTGGPVTTSGTISIADGGVNTTQLADAAVTTAKIGDGQVTGAKLEDSGVTASTYGSASSVPAITVDAKGRITTVTANSIIGLLPAASGGAGKYLKSDGTHWSGEAVRLSDIKALDGTSSAFNVGSCAANQTVAWSSLTDSFTCQNIGGLNASTLTSGTLDAARLPSSVTDGLWTANAGHVSRSSGHVGIGTAAPVNPLEIHSANALGVQSINTTSLSTAGSGGGVALLASALPTAADQRMGLLTFGARDGVATSVGAAVVGWSKNAWTAGSDYSSYLTFETAESNTTRLERMRIEASGKVGIGTANPSTLLHVNNSSDSQAILHLSSSRSASSASTSAIQFTAAASPAAAGKKNFSIYNVNGASGSENALVFASHNDDYSTFSPKMTLTHSGFIGIGTTAPSHPLHVNGIIHRGSPVMTGAESYAQLNGNDFILYNNDRCKSDGLGGTDPLGYCEGQGRMLVHDEFDTLHINFNGDFDGGTLISGSKLVVLGRIGIGTSNPSYPLHVVGDTYTSGYFRSPNGTIQTSDIRLKRNIEPVREALQRILSLRGVTYDWRTEDFPEKEFSPRHQLGVIAQDVEKQFPEAVVTDEKGYKAVNYPALVAPLIEAVRTLHEKIKELEDRNSVQEKSLRDLTALKEENQQLKSYLCAKDSAAPFCKRMEEP